MVVLCVRTICAPGTQHLTSTAVGRSKSAAAAATQRPAFKVIERRCRTTTRVKPGARFTACPKPVPGRQHGGYGHKPKAGGARKSIVVWLRNDLRLDDSEVLAAATKDGSSVLPVYCFDPQDYGKSPAGFDKTGVYRARFLLDCVADLRQRLRERGSDLLVRHGRPEQVLPALAQRVGAAAVYCQAEVTNEEAAAEARVRGALEGVGAALTPFWGSTLYHPDDLPFALANMPTSYGEFRDKMLNVPIRAAIDAPTRLKGWPTGASLPPGELPSLQQLGLSDEGLRCAAADRHAAAAAMSGGESEAKRRLAMFVSDAVGAAHTRAAGGSTAVRQAAAGSRDGGTASSSGGKASRGAAFSCKISPWLAMGCLSPRRMYQELQLQLPAQRPPGAVTEEQLSVGIDGARRAGGIDRLSWLQFELLWRDFFRFITKRYSSIEQLGPNAAPAAV